MSRLRKAINRKCQIGFYKIKTRYILLKICTKKIKTQTPLKTKKRWENEISVKY